MRQFGCNQQYTWQLFLVKTDGTIVHPGGASEGDKMLCVDNMIHDITHGTCLVYSFGIADDWTFEISMAALGCKVMQSHVFEITISHLKNCKQKIL